MRDTPHAVIGPVFGRRRRRSTSADPLKKVTLRMHETVAAAVRELVESGEAASADAFIEEAVIAQLRERRKARVYAAYAEAAADAVFMAEMEETNRVFEDTVADGLADAKL
ncbi:MAG: hypothetical protein ACT4R6_08425 [Gemmatimonadaceae bacterium]